MLRYLALGDSYTIGEGVEPGERWPPRLARTLRDRGVALEDPEIVAATGWTTGELTAALDTAKPQGPYALVTLLIGVNDQYRGCGVEAYLAGFRHLLARATEFGGGIASRVVVVSIPDWGVAPFAEGYDRSAIARTIDEFNAAARREVDSVGAWWVDVTAESRAAGGAATAYAADGLHPSGSAYEAWAKLIAPLARQALRAPPA